MKRKFRIRFSKMTVATSLIIISGLCGFAGVAISAEDSSPSSNQEFIASNRQEIISNGSPVAITSGVSISPIPGWRVEHKSAGMSLVMKEVSPETATDYSKPIFSRNISVMALPTSRPIDSAAISELKDEIRKMISRDPTLSEFTFTDAKLFDFKEKNDAIVLFSQLVVNNYSMMQMQIVVSGRDKAYLITYSDLAANFANPTTFDAAWKSMTSITVPGMPPKRYYKEMIVGGTAAGAILMIVVPFFLIRWQTSRRIRKLAEELQYDWDHGALKTDADYELSELAKLNATRPVRRSEAHKKAAGSTYESLFESSMGAVSKKQSFESSVDSFSTRHSRFG